MGKHDTAVGSLWRRWDLHLHTPETRLSNSYAGAGTPEAMEKYIDALEASPVQAFGVTDYFGCDAYFSLVKAYHARYPETKKVFFPNIELRLAESIASDGTLPHIHIILDNDPTLCGPEVLHRFCTNLETQSSDSASVRLSCVDLNTRAKLTAATVNLNDLTKALQKTFGLAKPYLVAFPANNNGLRSTDTKSPRKVSLANQIDRASDVIFGNAANRDHFLRLDRYGDGPSEQKPVIGGSDAHSFEDLERLSGDVAHYPSCWIKADLTFRGLQQICFEPDYRVFIGHEPDVLRRQGQDPTKFISGIEIDQIDSYDGRNGSWFKGVRLPLNPELTVIIGNKGSCKSALVDVLGLLGNTRQEQYFSFLTHATKNRKFRQPGFAENFFATIKWLGGKSKSKKLSDASDLTAPEAVRYLPQNYFEQLTNELEIEKFRQEVEEVVFSHVEETDRLGKTSFSELEEFKTQQSKEETSSLKVRLREINLEIVKLEVQGGTQFRRELEGRKTAKLEEFNAHEATKPAAFEKPPAEAPEQIALRTAIEGHTSADALLRGRILAATTLLSQKKSDYQELHLILEQLGGIANSVHRGLGEISPKLLKYGIKIEDVADFKLDVTPIRAKADDLRAEIGLMEAENAQAITAETDFGQLTTLAQMRSAQAYLKEQIEILKDQLSTPQRQYQVYVEKLAEWQARRELIQGTEDDPRSESLRGIESELKYLDEVLPSLLVEKRAARLSIVRGIFESKKAILGFYSDLKESVDAQLKTVTAEGFSIEIDASFVVDRTFRRDFMGHIDQRRRGHFRDTTDAEKDLAGRVSATDWNSVEAVIQFIEGILSSLSTYNGDAMLIADQVKDVKAIYDYLFSLEYFDAKYELRLGSKNLNQLSPGEKGLLLLVFYLHLDKMNTPLVIDQPEDNLDNDSIFQVLAKCIREAKKNRQVILVTHNPNLAVGADAEQVIYVRLDKTKKYQFSWETGAIENVRINERIVHVLEGSQPAFVKRRLKYGIS